MMIVVSNATPLIGLAMAERFDLLQKLFGRIYIPQGVYDEVVTEGGQRFGTQEVSNAAWIELVKVKDRLAVEVLADDLGKGESETIVLAREMGADWVLVDERLARRKLDALGIPGLSLTSQAERPEGSAVVVFIPYYKFSAVYHLDCLRSLPNN